MSTVKLPCCALARKVVGAVDGQRQGGNARRGTVPGSRGAATGALCRIACEPRRLGLPSAPAVGPAFERQPIRRQTHAARQHQDGQPRSHRHSSTQVRRCNRSQKHLSPSGDTTCHDVCRHCKATKLVEPSNKEVLGQALCVRRWRHLGCADGRSSWRIARHLGQRPAELCQLHTGFAGVCTHPHFPGEKHSQT